MGHSKTNRHVRNKKKEQSFFNNLTDELLIQIFIRLPSSKEAIRCKLVCKHWLSLISSDYFVNTSVIHHQNNGNDQVVVYNFRTDKVESSTLPSQFKLKRLQRLLPPDDRSLHLDAGPHHVLPITQNWWPTPVR
ncbi:uncharacterized protein LOC132633271 [Lycium barbarum]|uniref:uncharacterized protein LOC132633271 n=1 Tax=Lycium barbarum TaxID=112863 RepID=UPI00293E469E|nr:uncharacterized protein LOC132633271 [Lycium barbarum]